MGEVWDDVIEGSKQIGEKIGLSSYSGDSKNTKRKRRAALEAMKPRRAPNIDDASMRQQETDRLQRRRGVLANIYGGNNAAAPTVAVKQLLGS